MRKLFMRKIKMKSLNNEIIEIENRTSVNLSLKIFISAISALFTTIFNAAHICDMRAYFDNNNT